jgi:hypothetical protein
LDGIRFIVAMKTLDHLSGEAMNSHFQLLSAEIHSAELRRRATAARAAASGAARRSVPLPAAVDVVIRLAGAGDAAEIVRLAHLDGRRVPVGEVLVAVVEDEVLAALPLGDGSSLPRPLADPFRPTSMLVDLLWLRAAHLRGEIPSQGRRRGRLAARIRALLRRPAGRRQPAALPSHAPASPGNSAFMIR